MSNLTEPSPSYLSSESLLTITKYIGTSLLYGIDCIGSVVVSVMGIDKPRYQYIIDAQNSKKLWDDYEKKRNEEEQKNYIPQENIESEVVDNDITINMNEPIDIKETNSFTNFVPNNKIQQSVELTH